LEIIIIPLVVFTASILTFFSGFGLGTLLLPVFSIFFPIEIAIFATAIVHFFNSLFKLVFVFKKINISILLGFAPSAILFALFGGATLGYLKYYNLELTYTILVFKNTITPIKMIVGMTMITFAIIELLFKKKSFEITPLRLILGGMLSGFFGGLSGHQGAFRSMFLAKAEISKEEFIATSSATGFLIDVSRLCIYLVTFRHFSSSLVNFNPVLMISIAVAFLGSYVGSRVLEKITIKLIQKVVVLFLFLFGLLICLGFI